MLAKDAIPLSKIPDLCLMQRSIGLVTDGHGVVVSKVCYRILECVFSHLPLHRLLQWAFSNSGLEAGLPAFKLPMFAKRDALPNGYFSTCSSRESISGDSKHRGSWEYQLCIMFASCPSLRCSCRKKPVTCREADGLVTELWSPGLVEEYSDLRWFHVTTVTTMNRFGDWAFNQLLGLEVGL